MSSLAAEDTPQTKKASEASVGHCKYGFDTLQTAARSSLVKKHLSKDIFDTLKTRATVNNKTLYDVMVAGVNYADSRIGIYAPDPESYYVFKEIFDRVVEDCHDGYGLEGKQPQTDFGVDKLNVFADLDPDRKFVQSTTISVSRNIWGYPFIASSSRAQLEQIAARSKTALTSMTNIFPGSFYFFDGISKKDESELEKQGFLFERNDRELLEAEAYREWPKGRAVFIDDAKTFLVWVNEQDHLRITSMQKGADIKTVYDRLIRGLQAIETKLQCEFYRNDRFGWLTFSPLNLGTTMRAAVYIKLPKMKGKDLKVIGDALKVKISELHGKADHYEIRNKHCLGLTEFEAVEEVYNGVKELIRMAKQT